MEHFRKTLDVLPKRSYDVVDLEFEEGDVIYMYSGASGDYGLLDVMKIGQSTKGGLSCFYDNPRTGEIKETPIPPFRSLRQYFEAFRELRQKVNIKHDPFMEVDPAQRRLAIMKGEVTVRYKLVKKDGREFEIVI